MNIIDLNWITNAYEQIWPVIFSSGNEKPYLALCSSRASVVYNVADLFIKDFDKHPTKTQRVKLPISLKGVMTWNFVLF